MTALMKRVVDVTGAIISIVLSAPIMAAAMITVWATMGRPILYTQQRVGAGGHLFVIYKIRTMVMGADKVSRVPDRGNFSTFRYHEAGQDSRVTPVGTFLRRTSIDELPQLWNVLIGEMSLVGPRPELPEIVALYNDKERQRLTVKPGITGLAQVLGRSDLPMAEKIAYDLDYVEKASFWYDVLILLRTVRILVTGRGAR